MTSEPLLSPFSSIDRSSLADATERLVQALSPHSIHLFGSHATGVPGPDSDIDLFVIVGDDEPTTEQFRKAYACLRGVGLPVELHLSSLRRYERYRDVFGSFEHEIQRKGVLLHAAQT